MKNSKGTNANLIVDQLVHHNIHSEILINQYTDLRIVYDGGEIMNYYSSEINSEVNLFEYQKHDMSAYSSIYSILPFKEIKIDCPKCNNLIRINSIPSTIPFIIEHENSRHDYTWYATTYEEVYKSSNFSATCLAETQLHIINKLEEYKKNNDKVDHYFLSNNIKKLLPFA